MNELPDSLRGITSLSEEVRELLAAACDITIRPERLWNACALIDVKETAMAASEEPHRLARFLTLTRSEFDALPPSEHEDLCCFELAGCLNRYLSSVLSIEALHQYWDYTVACGIISRRLAPLCVLDPAAAFAGALVHDLGRLVLSARYPERYANLLTMAKRNSSLGIAVDLRDYERNLFGMDRYALGALLAKEWELPTELEPMLGEFDRVVPSTRFELVDLVRGSCQLAHCLGYGFLRGGETLHLRQVLSLFPQAVREELEANPALLAESTLEGLAASALWISAKTA